MSFKNDAESISFRASGIESFEKRTIEGYVEALKWLNKSLCFAESDEQLCLCYADRSIVYFHLHMFEECLENLNLVFKINKCPDALMENLRRLEGLSKERLQQDDPNEKCEYVEPQNLRTLERLNKERLQQDDPNENCEYVEPQLSFPPHEKVPYIANCIELRENKKYGKHVVSNRDLNVGDIIGIVKPYCTSRATEYKFECCENCNRERFRNLLPCPSCTSAMFCDENCMKVAIENFHKFECPVMDLINTKFDHQSEELALRLFLRGLSNYKDIDEFLDDTEKVLKRNITCFDIDNLNSSEQYAVVSSSRKTSAYNRGSVDPVIDTMYSVCGEIFAKSEIVSKKSLQEVRKKVKKILTKHLLMTRKCIIAFDDLSYHTVNKRDDPSYDSLYNRMCAIFPFLDLISHSCVPNVLIGTYTSGKIISVVRPIKAGEPLFHAFGGTYFDISKAERHMVLSFKCGCIACTENYPLNDELKRGPVSMAQEILSYLLHAYKFDKQNARACLRTVVDYLQDNDNHMPCAQLVEAFQAYYHMMIVIYSKEVCIQMHVNPIKRLSDIIHNN